jgi:cation diffusion facilitator CzcD-associated flavoprotein CzcO
MTATPDHHVAIIGAGFGGLGAAIELRRAGIDDFKIIEKWDGVGGTWRANTYPGVAVDIPSFIYSFSYEQRGNWSRLFAPGAELLAYAEDVADRHELRPHIRFGTAVSSMTFDESDDLWRLELEGDEGRQTMTARFVISAIGALERPVLPDIPGIDDFDGTIVHTARWDHGVDLRGKRVACIGTGASALQLIPEIAEDVASLDVYQRTPIWVAPKVDPRIGPAGRALLSVPPVRSALRGLGTATFDLAGNVIFQHRLGPVRAGLEAGLRAWMRRQVDDPATREALIPDYGFGCKRPSMSNGYLKAFNRSNVELVTTPIERIATGGVVTADGCERPVDVLVCATGFRIMSEAEPVPFPIHGRGGVELGAHWLEHRFHAYQGVSVCGFPNLFSVAGPYGFVVGSYFWMIEATTRHAARVIAEAGRRGKTTAEIRRGPQDRYVEQCRERQAGSPLFGEACATSNTYYVNFQGDSPLRPSLYAEMWWQNRHFPLSHYRFATAPQAPPAPRKGRTRRPRQTVERIEVSS